MRILITGATGNIGSGIAAVLQAAGHELVLYDIVPPPTKEPLAGLPYVQGDIQAGIGLDRAAAGCDVVLHTAAWHGVHGKQKTEADYWRLNVDGTFWTYQAAANAGIKRFVFLSSMAWHGTYSKYGFTKVLGEHLAEYYQQNHAIRSIIIRPHDLTPWRNFPAGYGARLLYGGVDREDVLDCVNLAVTRLLQQGDANGPNVVVQAVRANAFGAGQLAGWEHDAEAVCERIFPGSTELIRRYALDIKRVPEIVDVLPGAAEIGYTPKRHFGTFLAELRRLDGEIGQAAVMALRCPYGT